MPIYEYQCTACAHQFDALQKMSEPALTDCPACEATNVLSKLLSAPNFRLKGQGWYETDFKQAKQKNLAKADSQPDANASKSKTDKTETTSPTKPSKPETKKTTTHST